MTSLKEYRTFLRFIHFMNSIIGYHYLLKSTGIIQKCLMFLSLTIAVISTISTINCCILNISRLSIFIKAMGLAGSCSTITIKLLCALYYRKRLQNLNNDLTSRFEEDLRQTRDVSDLLCRMRQFSKPAYFYSGFLIYIGTTYSLLPIIVLLKYNKYITILPSSYKPLNIYSDLRIYITVYAIEFWTQVSLSAVTISADALFWLYLGIICGELRVISKKYDSLFDDVMNYQKNLRECVSRHCNIIRHTKNVQVIYGPIVIWLSISSAVVICGQVLQIAHATSVLQLVVLFVYSMIKLIQVFLYSRGPEFVFTESENCLYKAFASIQNDKIDVSMMRNMIVITAQKPLNMKAFGFYRISLELFSKIVNASISFFFLVQTFESK